jgi:hypothetical protein
MRQAEAAELHERVAGVVDEHGRRDRAQAHRKAAEHDRDAAAHEEQAADVEERRKQAAKDR